MAARAQPVGGRNCRGRICVAIAGSFTDLTLVHSPYGAGYDRKQGEAET